MGCFSSAHANQNADEEYDKAVLNLKVNRDRVKKYQSRLEEDNLKQTELAKKLAKEGKLERAKLVLKAKKAREVLIQKTDGMLTNLQEQLNNLEQARITREFAENMQQTNSVLKEMNEKLTVEMVENLMEENAEQTEKVNEVTELLGQSLTPDQDQEAEEEFEKMWKEMHGEESPQEAAEEVQAEKPEKQKELFAALA